MIKFYRGRFLLLLGSFMVVASISDMFSWLMGLGVALFLMGGFLSDYYFLKETDEK